MFKGDLKKNLEGDLELDLEGEIEGDSKGDFKQDIQGRSDKFAHFFKSPYLQAVKKCANLFD